MFFVGEGNVQVYMEEVVRMVKLVIDSQLFDLDNMGVEDGYYILFNCWDYLSSKEIMLWKKFDCLLGFWYNDNCNFGCNGVGVGLIRVLVDFYFCISEDGIQVLLISLVENYVGDINLLNVVVNCDLCLV